MSSHPDANAFMRSYLRNPPDVTTRLVFADWLEETGESSNVAWARFIRLKAEAGGVPRRSARRIELERQAAIHATQVQARLTIPAAHFVAYAESIMQLLPPDNLTVRLGNFRPTHEILRRVDEETARTIPILPLDDVDGVLIVAHPIPVDEHDVLIVRSLTSPATIVVGGIWDEIVGLLNATLAVAGERDDRMQHLFDLPGEFDPVPGTYPVHNVPEFLEDVLTGGQRREADLVTFIPQGNVVRVFYRTPRGAQEAGHISQVDWRYGVFPEIIRRGEATGCEFTVEVVRNGGERAVRIWLLPMSRF